VLPSFVITLREGLEAALIIGIVAAFLVREGRPDALKRMWIGVGAAVAVCLAAGVVLRVVDRELPERGQQVLETVIAFVAVAMVTYMIVWMKQHARSLRGSLEGSAANAVAAGSAGALIAMAFFAVFREGFETAVFLIAVFQQGSSPVAAGIGAVLGLVAALAIGWGIYRGGVRLNLQRFFKATGVILVIVAAGLFASGVHSAQELGWIGGADDGFLDLSWLVHPGTWTASLMTGILGLRASMSSAMVVGWLLYAVPMTCFVLWPQGRRTRRVPAAQQAPSRAAA
jgi:high-affinity iron transporter